MIEGIVNQSTSSNTEDRIAKIVLAKKSSDKSDVHLDENLKEITPMSPQQIILLFKTIVKTTYFSFNRNLYTQVDGLAIGAATSGFAANLFMEHLEARALATFATPPTIWLRFVDDTFAKLLKIDVEAFLHHLNNQHPRIKFTTEEEKDRKLPFLDALVHKKQDGYTKTTIYRKPTHTDQYLNWKSNHHISQKANIIKTFEHRINTIITEEEDKPPELKHVKTALKKCGHPNWTLNKKPKPPAEKMEPLKKVSIPYIQGNVLLA